MQTRTPLTTTVAHPTAHGAQEIAAAFRGSRRLRSIRDVVAWDLCCGCGACYSACSHDAVRLVNVEASGIRPQVDASLCGTCTECLLICPGSNVDVGGSSAEAKHTHADELGPYLEIWEGYAADPEIRFKGASGGVISALTLYCIEREDMGFALHVAADESQPWVNATVRSLSRGDLLSRAGSRYSPASPCDSLRSIEESPRPCVFIGKPCDAEAVSMLRSQRPDLDQKLGLVLAFFCGGTPSSQGTMQLLQSLHIDPARVSGIRYRGEGWPGRFEVRCGANVAQPSFPYLESWQRLTSHRPLRCHLCPDGMGQVADIACADAWHRFKDDGDSGQSIVVVRTRRGQQILAAARASGYVELRPSGPDEVLQAQPGLMARHREIFGRLLARRLLLLPSPQLRNFSLFQAWMRLPWKRKVGSIAGTLRRLIFRGRWWSM